MVLTWNYPIGSPYPWNWVGIGIPDFPLCSGGICISIWRSIWETYFTKQLKYMHIPIPIRNSRRRMGIPLCIFGAQTINSGLNGPMISPTISDSDMVILWFHQPSPLMKSLTLHTASLLLVYCILKVTAHFIGYFSRNSISNFQKFLKKFQNRTFLKFVPSKHFLITFLVNVQSTWKFIFR